VCVNFYAAVTIFTNFIHCLFPVRSTMSNDNCETRQHSDNADCMFLVVQLKGF